LIIFTIPGEVTAKARPRVTRYGTYTPEKTRNYETLVKEMFHITYGQLMLEGELGIEINLYFQIPKSASKKKKELMEKGHVRPIKRPDWDNCGKAIADALNGLAYRDDSQIVEAIVKKYYSNVPRAEVYIYKIQSEYERYLESVLDPRD